MAIWHVVLNHTKKNTMKHLILSALLVAFTLNVFSQRASRTATPPPMDDRTYWVNLLYQMSEPILRNMSKGELKKNMVVEYSPTWDNNRNRDVAYMEAFGRLIAGIAPWLALPDDDTPEGRKRKQVREWTLASLKNAVDPDSPDHLMWNGRVASQVLVDAAFIANAFIRAPQALWEPLDELTKRRYIENFKALRVLRTPYNNWLLFRAMVETFLLTVGEDADGFAINMAIRKTDEWYVGDGWYKDGPGFALDYYNSFVIHPMLVEILEVLAAHRVWSPLSLNLAKRRMERYARLSERRIAPDATFSLIGRSMTYRLAAFQVLALTALRDELPQHITHGQMRNALTNVMKRMFSGPSNFCKDGYLLLGFVGYQPDLADFYVNTGSLYITSAIFLPLGLPANHAFWTAPAEDWTSRKAWEGKPVPKDYYEGVFQ